MTDEAFNVEYKQLSDQQEMLLAILPIPSATFSILGSSIIIYMAIQSRKEKPWTPYNRLLLVMSVCDIISSATLGAASFLYPKETSSRIWAMGNGASCSAIGFLNQFSYSGVLYNSMLSFYFLLTARFGFRNLRIAQRIEPMMHTLSLGYPTITAIIGLLLNTYGERSGNLGCWVARCEYKSDGIQEDCGSFQLGLIFGGWVFLFALLSLIINNLIILVFVRRQTRMAKNMKKKSLASSTEIQSEQQNEASFLSGTVSLGTTQQDDLSQSMATSIRTFKESSNRQSTNLTDKTNDEDLQVQAQQRRRLRLVSSQAFFFVGSYFICNAFTYILRIREHRTVTYVEAMEFSYNFFPVLMLHAVLYPLQGYFNMLVYMRPKYLKNRSDFPKESRRWSFRRAIYGSTVQPLHSVTDEREVKARAGEDVQQSEAKDMQSSIGTRSDEHNSGSAPTPSTVLSTNSNFSLGLRSGWTIMEGDNEAEDANVKRAITGQQSKFASEHGKRSNIRSIKMDGSLVEDLSSDRRYQQEEENNCNEVM